MIRCCLTASMVAFASGACTHPEDSSGALDDSGIGARDAMIDSGLDSGRDVAEMSAWMDIDRPCPRGEHLEDGVCVSAAGCSQLQLTRDDLGCLYYPDTTGRFTTAECEVDADCAGSPYGENCILRVCQTAERCAEDNDCADGEECVGQAACIPERSACESDDDCLDPGFCLPGEGICV